ncbi:MAG: hypothetical protein DRJ40_08780 [Thermoprotei archaeon]|nr:MAG: hypothetical protein DRJ40_08780 [Thermoprotei archaeon]
MSTQNPFTRAKIPVTDARIAATLLALAVRTSFTIKDVVNLLKELGDTRSESTLQAKAREVARALSEAGILRALESRGRRKVFALQLSKEDLEKFMPPWLQRYYRDVLSKLERGEVKIGIREVKEVTKPRTSTTLDLFFEG